MQKSERDEKIKKFGNKHIRAILYEAGHHEAVRIILEHLLEETAPDIYKKLSEHIGTLKLYNFSERFSYKSPIAPTLVGIAIPIYTVSHGRISYIPMFIMRKG